MLRGVRGSQPQYIMGQLILCYCLGECFPVFLRIINHVPGLYQLDTSSRFSPRHPPGYDNQKCVQILPKVPCGAKSPAGENRSVRFYSCGGSEIENGRSRRKGTMCNFSVQEEPVPFQVILDIQSPWDLGSTALQHHEMENQLSWLLWVELCPPPKDISKF